MNLVKVSVYKHITSPCGKISAAPNDISSLDKKVARRKGHKFSYEKGCSCKRIGKTT